MYPFRHISPTRAVGSMATSIAVALQSTALKGIPSPDTLVVFVILILVLAIRPQGLLGKAS